jgi:hypothetical protein
MCNITSLTDVLAHPFESESLILDSIVACGPPLSIATTKSVGTQKAKGIKPIIRGDKNSLSIPEINHFHSIVQRKVTHARYVRTSVNKHRNGKWLATHSSSLQVYENVQNQAIFTAIIKCSIVTPKKLHACVTMVSSINNS